MICAIAGMHRSGTSLMAQWLAQAGLPLTIGGTIAADISNPRGYYEDLDFVRLHTSHIRKIERQSFGWRYTPVDFLVFDDGELARARKLITTRNVMYPNWGWKDPRTTLFLPVWKRLIPDLKVIIVWRACTMVVSSLITRGLKQSRRHLWVGPVQAIRLWLGYNHLALAYKTQFPEDTVVVNAAKLPDAYEVIFQHITTRLELDLSPVVVNDLFISGLLHRQRSAWLQRLCALIGSVEIETQLLHLSVGQ